MHSFRVVKKVAHIYFFIFLCSLNNFCFGAPSEIVRNLNLEFLSFNQTHQTLIPITNNSLRENVIYLRIAAADILNHKLLIKSNKDFCLFVNGKIAHSKQKGSYWFEINDFISQQNSKDHLILAIYAEDVVNTLKVDLYRNLAATTGKPSTFITSFEDLGFLQKSYESKNKYLIGLIISLLAFIGLKILIPNIYQSIFKSQIGTANALMSRASSKLSNFQNEGILVFCFISVLAAVYTYVFLDQDTYVFGYKILDHSNQLSLVLFGLLGTFFLFLAKYLIYTLFSFVFGVKAFAKILINEFSKTIFQSILFIYPAYFILFSPFLHIDVDPIYKFIYPIILVLIIYLLKELYFFYQLFNSNKFYIIAYICICDLFPTCVFLKILSQSEFI